MRTRLFSLGYRIIRHLYIQCGLKQNEEGLEKAIDKGDANLATLHRLFRWPLFKFGVHPSLSTSVYDLTFRSPIIFSSFKDDLPMVQMWLAMGVGGGMFKTIMLLSRSGNPKPRIQEVIVDNEKCLYNAMGLPGKGVNKFLDAIFDKKLNCYGSPLAFSIGGANREEYLQVVKVIESKKSDINFEFFYELNISCPNTEDGQDMMKYTEVLTSLIEDLRGVTDRVISVKLSPDQKDQKLVKLVEAIRPFSKMMVNLGNTQFKTPDQVGLSSKRFSMPGGGLSGRALRDRTMAMVTLLEPLGVPIIATGGLSTVEDVKEAQNRGAVLCGMATALVQDPYCIPKINQALLKQR